jgi:hypothetical protein
MNRLAKLLTVVAAATAVMIGMAPAALAGTDADSAICNPACPTVAAHIHFESNGDDFHVWDDVTDGYSAVLFGYRPDGTSFTRWLDSGGGTEGWFYFDFTEGGTVTFSTCLGTSSTRTIQRCSIPVNGIA